MPAKTIQTKSDRTAKLETTSFDQMATGVSQASFGVIACLAALIGVWGLVCLLSGLSRNGGLIEAMKGYLTAIGM